MRKEQEQEIQENMWNKTQILQQREILETENV